MERVVWLDELPKGFRGVVLGNEVLDAMPVHLFRFQSDESIAELCVEWDGKEFAFCDRELTEGELFEHVVRLKKGLGAETLYPGYVSEVNLQSQAWVQSIADALESGVVLLADYGFPQHEYYHPDRAMGTLMCHYRHHSHGDPLILPGLQDITAHVDFTAVALSGQAAGLQLMGYTTQAHFLLSSGLDDMVAQSDPHDAKKHLEITQQVKKLVMPNEMGELFKVIAMAKQYSGDMIGFAKHDMSDRL